MVSTAEERRKVVIGNAGGSGGTKKRAVGDTTDPASTEAGASEKRAKHANVASGDMSSSDQAIVDSFQERINGVKDLSPPTADAAFRAYITDHLGKMTAISNEIRTKKKSASRRKSTTADELFLEHLGGLESNLKEMIKIVRCALAFVTFVFV